MEMPSNDKQWTLPVLSKYIKENRINEHPDYTNGFREVNPLKKEN